MSESDDDWPRQAWAPPGSDMVVAGVALEPGDMKSGLTRWAYRSRLASRILWMVQSAPAPELAVALLAEEMEAQGLWEAGVPDEQPPWATVAMLLDDNPLWPDYLNLLVELPEQEPMPMHPMPEVERALRETTLEEWLSRAFLSMSGLT